MIKRITERKQDLLEGEISYTLVHLEGMEPTHEDYASVLDNLERLYKVKNVKNERLISNDTIAIIAGNLLGIGLILSYEKMNVISTKALNFVMKGRV